MTPVEERYAPRTEVAPLVTVVSGTAIALLLFVTAAVMLGLDALAQGIAAAIASVVVGTLVWRTPPMFESRRERAEITEQRQAFITALEALKAAPLPAATGAPDPLRGSNTEHPRGCAKAERPLFVKLWDLAPRKTRVALILVVLGTVAGGLAYSQVQKGRRTPAAPRASSLAAVPVTDAGAVEPPVRITCSQKEYDDKLAAELAKCDPQAMLGPQGTIPFSVYGNAYFRKAVADVMASGSFNGWSWMQAANDGGVHVFEWKVKDPIAESWLDQRRAGRWAPDASDEGEFAQGRNRLVRMSAACDQMYFHGTLLTVEQSGSMLTVRASPSVNP